jgi:concentrative nucleoside transporter, CNT family
MQSLQSLLGIFALLGFAWILSEDRRAVAWRQAAVALLTTFATAVLILKLPGGTRLFDPLNRAVEAIASATRAGTAFVFGYLGGGALPFKAKQPGAEFVLALQALPIVMVMSVLTTLLFHWRILPPVVYGFS